VFPKPRVNITEEAVEQRKQRGRGAEEIRELLSPFG
jgi:hypothetical protein